MAEIKKIAPDYPKKPKEAENKLFFSKNFKNHQKLIEECYAKHTTPE